MIYKVKRIKKTQRIIGESTSLERDEVIENEIEDS
jgi:hypothetical protein